MRLIITSDTHGSHESLDVPDGDVFIHAGDFTNMGELYEIADFNEWLGDLPHPHKIVIAGNHDLLFEQDPSLAKLLLSNATYLQDDLYWLNGISFYGSPWQPEFNDWAFNLPRGAALRKKWAMIPDGVDVLITHGPPFGILDNTLVGAYSGCQDLLAAIDRVRPRLSVFGHIHEGYGQQRHSGLGTTFINASALGTTLGGLNPPFVVDL